MTDKLSLAARVEAYDPKLSPDNRADELALHQDIVLATGIGAMEPAIEATFVRSLDAALSLVPASADASGERFRLEHWNTNGVHAEHVRASAWVAGAPRVYAATPALALTAACLRALATDENKEGGER